MRILAGGTVEMTITPCWADAGGLKTNIDAAAPAKTAAVVPVKRLTIASSFVWSTGTQQGRNNPSKRTRGRFGATHPQVKSPEWWNGRLARLHELQRVLVGVATDGRVEDRLGVIVARTAQELALRGELEPRGSHFLHHDVAVDSVHFLDLCVGQSGRTL